MSNLFIIGNGFDLAHGLPTSYEDFYQYLISKYPKALDTQLSYKIERTKMPDGTVDYNKNEVVAFLIDRISAAERDGENWCDIETSLGHLDFNNYIRELYSLVDKPKETDDEDNLTIQRRYWKLTHACEIFYDITIKIQELFSEWINTIDISAISPMDSFIKLLDPSEDSFLTFNYTTVLEDIYGATEVKHLHGVQNGEIIFGHGEKKAEKHVNDPYQIIRPLLILHDDLKKDTQGIVSNDLSPFLNNLVESSFKNDAFIKRIYTYGFSFSRVDLPYVQEICLNIDTSNITWYLHTFHKDEERKGFEENIKECGFKGRFDTFG
ncbi:bacteriophage abortive infection AbiH family protein (plasmid) [Priestia megaterium]|uniref:bacteriophage abortive infection AbiH family protein n=1 Tax=Priestia megaterium TaxID=1404 RepID=UPI0030F45E03